MGREAERQRGREAERQRGRETDRSGVSKARAVNVSFAGTVALLLWYCGGIWLIVGCHRAKT